MAVNRNVQQVAQAQSQPQNVPPAASQYDDIFNSVFAPPEGGIPELKKAADKATGNAVEQINAFRDTLKEPSAVEIPPDNVEAEGAELENVFTPSTSLVEPEPGFIGANIQQFETLGLRALTSLAKDPKAQETLLRKRLGTENVSKDPNGNFLIRLPGKEKFRKLDSDSFELIGDLFADNFRESISGTLGAAGAVAGTSAPLFLGPAGIAGPIAGFTGGFAAGEAGIDMFVENYLGIPRSEERGGIPKSDEIGDRVVAGFERSLESISEGLSAATFNKVFQRVGDAVSERISKRAARRTALRQAKEISESDVLSETIKDNLDTIREMRDMGFVKTLPGSDLPVLAHQALPTRGSRELAESLKGNKTYENIQKKAAQSMGDALLDMTETAAGLQRGSLKQVVRSGVKPDRAGLSGKVTGLLNDSIRAEGKLIEEFRSKAKQTATTAALPSDNTVQALTDIFDQLGVRRRGGELIFPDDDTIAQLLGNDSPAIIRGFKRDLEKLGTSLAMKGGLTIDELIGQSKLIGNKNNAAGRIGGAYKKFIGQLSSGLRKDAREAMPYVLDEADSVAYNQSMDKFRQFADAREQLKNLLDEDIGANTFTRLLLTKGKAGLGNLRAAKEFLLREHPDTWNNIKSEFIEELAVKHRLPGDVSGIEYNVKGMRKELASLGQEFLEEMFPKNSDVSIPKLMKAFDASEQVKNAIISGDDSQLKKVGKELVGTLSSFVSAKVNAAWALMHLGTSDKRLYKLMANEGIEEFLEKVPKKEKGKMRKLLGSLIQFGKDQGLLKTVGEMSRVTGAGMSGGSAVNLGRDAGSRLDSQIMQRLQGTEN